MPHVDPLGEQEPTLVDRAFSSPFGRSLLVEQRRNLSALPLEVFGHIFCYLPHGADRARLRSTCRVLVNAFNVAVRNEFIHSAVSADGQRWAPGPTGPQSALACATSNSIRYIMTRVCAPWWRTPTSTPHTLLTSRDSNDTTDEESESRVQTTITDSDDDDDSPRVHRAGATEPFEIPTRDDHDDILYRILLALPSPAAIENRQTTLAAYNCFPVGKIGGGLYLQAPVARLKFEGFTGRRCPARKGLEMQFRCNEGDCEYRVLLHALWFMHFDWPERRYVLVADRLDSDAVMQDTDHLQQAHGVAAFPMRENELMGCLGHPRSCIDCILCYPWFGGFAERLHCGLQFDCKPGQEPGWAGMNFQIWIFPACFGFFIVALGVTVLTGCSLCCDESVPPLAFWPCYTTRRKYMIREPVWQSKLIASFCCPFSECQAFRWRVAVEGKWPELCCSEANDFERATLQAAISRRDPDRHRISSDLMHPTIGLRSLAQDVTGAPFSVLPMS
jgi:hypothetical protein